MDAIFLRLWGKHVRPQSWGQGTSDNHKILLFYFIWKRTPPAALNSALLTQQWKCHPVRKEMSPLLQHLGFLWRSRTKILNESIFWTDLLFLSETEYLFCSRLNDRILQKKKNTCMTMSKCSFYRKQNISFYFIVL